MFAKQPSEPNPTSQLLVGGFTTKFEVEEIPYKYSVSKEAQQELCQNILTYSGLVFFAGQGNDICYLISQDRQTTVKKFHINLTKTLPTHCLYVDK